MPLIPVFSAPCLSVDYDSQRDCLFLTLQGQPELLALQDITVAESGPPPVYPARCLVQDDMAPAGAQTEVTDWLLHRLLPSLHRAGIKRWAWVCSPTPRSRQLAKQVNAHLPQLELTLFNDLEHASTWLRQLH